MTGADDWQPPPGMVKRTCECCGHQFARLPGRPDICPTCQVPSQRRSAHRESLFEAAGRGRRIHPKGIGGGG